MYTDEGPEPKGPFRRPSSAGQKVSVASRFVNPALLLLALARPMDVIEEWTLLDTTPVRHAVVARAVYPSGGDGEIEVPSVFSQGMAPEVSLVGAIAPCPVWRVGDRWHARIPATGSARPVRVIARRVDATPGARLFRLPWPLAVGEASRRVALIPRGWLAGPSEGWSCADDEVSTLACVSIDTRPNPLAVRVAPARSTRLEAALAALAAPIALAAAWLGDRENRPARIASLGGALLAGGAIALALVGAHWISWAAGLLVALAFSTLATRVAVRDERARQISALGLLLTTLLATLEGHVVRVLCAAVVTLLALHVRHALGAPAARSSPAAA
jgi:hypothetical protein